MKHRGLWGLLMVMLIVFIPACAGAGANEGVGNLGVEASAPPAVEQPPEATEGPVIVPTRLEPGDSTASPTPQPASGTPAPLPATEISPPSTPTGGPNVPAGFPDPAQFTWELAYSGLAAPIGAANPGDGSGRLFFIEQGGRIRVGSEGVLAPEPFLDIDDRVGANASEQGLLGLAFHPNYEENGYFFVNYTNNQGNTVISRFQVTAEDPNRADPGSETVLFTVSQPFANHNGGALAFGPDGYLYLGLGDGGSGGDPQNNGQSTQTLLGKVLRIDVDQGETYGIPADNPFAGGGGLPEIWAYGLRNPWRFSFDRATGDFYIGDVGQGSFEEIDFQPAGSPGGENYGWNIMEGFDCFQRANCDTTGLTQPVHAYPTHEEGTCAVTGGYVYRGQALPEWQGIYIYGDYCSGHVWGLFRDAAGNWQNQQLFRHSGYITAFGEDEQGEIYLVDYAGEIYQLRGR